MQLFSNDLGVDLGTANVLIYESKNGVVVREPSVVAMDKNSGRLLKVGADARSMLGRTPGNVVAMHPLKAGVISDQEMTVRMLQELFRKALKSNRFFTPKPRVVIAVPSGVTEVEERTVINAAIEAGARRVYLIEEPMAAALGANMDVSGPTGHMVVDIGAGTTDTAVLTMNSIATSSSIQVAGDNFDEAIARYVRRYHGVTIGLTIAEDIKINIGNLFPQGEDTPMTVLGRDVKTGMPRELSLTSSDIREVLYRLARQICDDVLSVLENTSPELVSDVARNGIVLTGGGCQLRGMDQLLSERTGVRCAVADDPASCVVFGCGKSLASINKMREGPINIARKRILKG